MPQMKKLNTATSEYFHDLFMSLYHKCPIGKLIGHSTYNPTNRTLQSNYYGELISGVNNVTKQKKVRIKTVKSNGKRVQYEIEVYKNSIRFYKDKFNKNEFDLITNAHDYFNLIVQYDINISYDDLLLIQKLMNKVFKKRNITFINLHYECSEEKRYGY